MRLELQERPLQVCFLAQEDIWRALWSSEGLRGWTESVGDSRTQCSRPLFVACVYLGVTGTGDGSRGHPVELSGP